MSCDDSTICSTISTTTASNYSYYGSNEETISKSLLLFTTESPHWTTKADTIHSRHQLHAAPDEGIVTAILCFSVLVFVSSFLALLATHWSSSARGTTFVFLRSSCLSDILMSIYGTSKMTMLLLLDRLSINFFLPESLFFTASFASTVFLLFFTIDCYMKLARPLHYKKVDKDNVTTFILLVWNAAFVVGFLPLIGWNQEDNTVHFFSFYPWHYLFFIGCINFVCAAVCIGCLASMKRFHTHSQLDFDSFSTRMLEVRKFKHVHRTIVVESALWLLCYVPFFLYIALTCSQCLLSDFLYRDTVIIYFIPIFMMKSLLSSVLQALRTLHISAFMDKSFPGTSMIKHLRTWRREKRCLPKEAGVAAISYTNPLCEHDDVRSNGENHIMLDHNQFILHHSVSDMELRDPIYVSDFYSSISSSGTSLMGNPSCSLRSSQDSRQTTDSVLQGNTEL